MTDANTLPIEAAARYAKAFHEADADTLSDLFLPDCKLQFVDDGALKCFLASGWIDLVSGRPSLADQGHPLSFQITSVQFAGPTCVAISLEMKAPPTLFQDVLHLLCIDGSWKIVAKSFGASPIDAV